MIDFDLMIPLNMSNDRQQQIINMIAPQHRGDLFINTVLLFCDLILDANIDLTPYFWVDTAVGDQLDKIGELVGVSRILPFVPSAGPQYQIVEDDMFRRMIYAQIARNMWDGTIPHIHNLWAELLPDRILVIIDHFDMTIDVVVYNTESDIERELIAGLFFMPKPAGVRVRYSFPGDYPVFGYDRDDDLVQGYDAGMWIQGI